MGGWLFFQEINFWGIFWCGLIQQTNDDEVRHRCCVLVTNWGGARRECALLSSSYRWDCLFVEIRRIYRHQGICGHSSECRVGTGDWRPPLRWRLVTSEMIRGLLLSAAAPSISREWSFLRCRVEMSLGWGRAGDIMTECTINIALILHYWLLHRHRCDS